MESLQTILTIANTPGAAARSPARYGLRILKVAQKCQFVWKRRQFVIAGLATIGIVAHLVLRYGVHAQTAIQQLPLIGTLALGGAPLLFEVLLKLARGQFGSDLLAGISITASIFLGEYLAGAFVVLMLSGGEALEGYAIQNASAVLRALARRMPAVAHCIRDSKIVDIAPDGITIGDDVVIFPHETCPVDGIVVEGHGMMDESFLTGEPFQMAKAPGAQVLSGSINGENALTIRATRKAVDSRYEKIMEVMRASERDQPPMRRIADQIGAIYTPVALAIAGIAWLLGSQATRFLAVLVVATPCPLLIAIPVAIIGSISLSARRGIVVKKPAILERVDRCRSILFDKTGTLTYGKPRLSSLIPAPGFNRRDMLALSASLEQYSKHPLAQAVVAAAVDAGLPLHQAKQISEPPGQGLSGTIAGKRIQITSRKKLPERVPAEALPPDAGGLECIVLIDGEYAATLRFRDEPRTEGTGFVHHLGPRHRFVRLMLVSGDRESEVRFLAGRVGITDVYWSQTPEQKLQIVREETRKGNTIFVGDGINDAPALMAATVGIAMGQNSDITTEAAGAVILDSSLRKVDEFLHISHRMRRIALQSAIGGMGLSVVAMIFAAAGFLPPVAGAVCQEVIDVLAVANALRSAWASTGLTDF